MDEQELVNEPFEPKQDSDEELEQERLHQERRAKRIAQMKQEKQRQQELRRKMKLYIGIAAGCICLFAAVIVSIAVFSGRDPKEGEGKKAASGAAVDAQDADRQDAGAPGGGAREAAAGIQDAGGQDADAPGGGAQEVSGQGFYGQEALASASDNTAADSKTGTTEGGESADAAKTGNALGADSGNGIFFPGYTAEITESTPYISSENVISSYAILLNLDTGEVTAQRDAKTVISPASMTKILTLLVAAEHVRDLDDTFTMTLDITDYAYVHDCSTAGFLENEVVTVRDLMYGTILPSGGEAAAALAVYTAGSLDAFVDMMNDKLAELGLSDTAHFTNCVGLYDEDHHCSVYDMAMILKAAAENELCREVLSAHTYTTSATEQHPEGIILSNWFLRRIEDKDTHGEVICAKTGFVNQSGNCGASYAVSNSGGHYICVTGNAWSSWRCIYDQVEIYQEYTN